MNGSPALGEAAVAGAWDTLRLNVSSALWRKEERVRV